ncbi:MAG: ATP-binding protein [bacterium]|nr:ATP-binding protein [bacterium]
MAKNGNVSNTAPDNLPEVNLKELYAAVSAVNDAVIITDSLGRIIFVNREFEKQSGWTLAEVCNSTPRILRSGHHSSDEYSGMWATILEGKCWRGRMLNRRKPDISGEHSDVQYYWVDSTISPYFADDGALKGFVTVQKDVSELVQAEEIMRQQYEGSQLRAAVAAVLTEDLSLRERCEKVLPLLLDYVGKDSRQSGGILQFDDVAHLLKPLVVIGEEPCCIASVDGSIPLGECVCGTAALSGEMVISDVSSDVAVCNQDISIDNSFGYCVVPMMYGGTCQGVFYLRCLIDARRADEKVKTYKTIAEMLAMAFAKERAIAVTLEAQKKAEEASRVKSEFLANMSHEIRTPMNGIIGTANFLMESELSDETRDLVHDIQSSATMLLGIINNILDISKIESGRMELNRVQFNLPDLLHQVMAVVKVAALEKNVSVILYSEGIPEIVVGDDLRLRQVLINLLANALKFTVVDGAILLRVVLQQQTNDLLMLEFSVTDSGIGIQSEKQKQIFQPFRQADNSITRKFGGTGLGLSISQNLVEMMGGELLLASKPEVGSVFYFTLPLGRVALLKETAENTASEKGASSEGSALQLRILLVEDNKVNEKLASRYLGKMGCQVTVARNGAEAVSYFPSRASEFDLVLMDCQMPVMSGYDATRMIRDFERNTQSHMRIIAMTANAMEGDRERCLAAGMDDYIGKPIDWAIFRKMLLSL